MFQLNFNDYYSEFIESLLEIGYRVEWKDAEFDIHGKKEIIPVRVIINPIDNSEILLHMFYDKFMRKMFRQLIPKAEKNKISEVFQEFINEKN